MPNNLKVLHLDIETTPNISYTWGLFKQFIAPNQIIRPSTILCWAAKWHGKGSMLFSRTFPQDKVEEGLEKIHALLSQADAVVHYNGNSFDIPRLNQEFALYGFAPPAPAKQLDLYRVVRSKFKLPSNKLEYVSKHFNLGGKLKHPGMPMWIACMDGDESQWALMERYNKMDVRLLEKLYNKLLPWIDKHPNLTMDGLRCVNCGDTKLQQRGKAVTSTMEYQRYQCQKCGKWMRARLREQDAPRAELVSLS